VIIHLKMDVSVHLKLTYSKTTLPFSIKPILSLLFRFSETWRVLA